MSLTRTQYTESINRVGGYYNFITILNRRIKELRNDAPPMVQPEKGEDLIDLVVREIDSGFLELHGGSPHPDEQEANADS